MLNDTTSLSAEASVDDLQIVNEKESSLNEACVSPGVGISVGPTEVLLGNCSQYLGIGCRVNPAAEIVP